MLVLLLEILSPFWDLGGEAPAVAPVDGNQDRAKEEKARIRSKETERLQMAHNDDMVSNF